MVELEIPGRGTLQIEHLVCDVNGTLAVDGELLPGVVEAIERNGAMSPSELQRATGAGLRSVALDDIRRCCDSLVDAGVLVSSQSKNNRGYRYELPCR